MRWRELVMVGLTLAICCGCADKQTKILKLIDQIKSNEFDPDQRDTEEKLVRFGKAALPHVLKEFRKSDTYIFWSLTKVLAQIPAPERDDAFIEVLSNYQTREDNWLAHWYASKMLDALGENHCQKAVPVIQKIATSIPINEEVRAHANTALALLNHPLPPRPVSLFLKIDRDVEPLLSRTSTSQPAHVLYATIDQVFHPTTSPLTLIKVEKVGPEKIVDNADWPTYWPEDNFTSSTVHLTRNIKSAGDHILFSGGFTNVEGSWRVTVSMFKANVALITADQYFGPLAGAGYLGRAELRNGRWLIVDWNMTFIS